MEKRNVPKLRFKGFEDEWSEYKLGDLGEFKNGINKSKEDFGFGVPFINLMNVFGKNVLLNDSYGLVNATSKEIKENNLLKGDVLFIRSSVKREGVGETVLIGEDLLNTVYSGFLIRFREYNKVIFNDYKKYCFSTKKFRNNLIAKSSTSANTNINQESLKVLKLNLSSIEEQTKIANFLSNVDNIIEEQEGKVKDLEQYKKGMMQKIFKQEVRFKDENGGEYPEWEEKFAGDMFYNISDKNHNGKLEVLSVTQDKGVILRKDLDIDIKFDLESVKNYKKVKAGDFIISLRSFQGGFELSNIEGIVSPAYTVFNFKEEKNNCKYFHYIFKSELFIRKLSGLIYGIRDGKAISFNDFRTMKLKYPCLEEQTKIANFLSNIDNIIEEEKKKLEDLKLWKKGLLQQMFV